VVVPASGPVVDIEIVGEASYQAHIKLVERRHGVAEFTIGLRAQPDNPYDANAVAVYADGGIVGFLPRDLAKHWQPAVLAAEAQGSTVLGTATIYGGTPDKPNLGVFGSATWPGEGKPLDRYHRGK
jgi:hypothetical protein